MDSLPPDAISVLTEVVVSTHLSGFISWLSAVIQDPRLRSASSGYSFDPETSTLRSNKIPDTVPPESVLTASTVPDDQSSAGTSPQYGTKSVHFQEPADDLSVPHDKNSNSVETPAKGVLKNGLGDTPPGQRVATSHPHRGDGVPAAERAIDSIERRADPDSGSVASEIHLAGATGLPVFDHLDRYSDVSSLSDASNDGRHDVDKRALSENPYAYSSAEEDKAMRRGQTLTGEAPLQFNGVHEQPNDAESYVSNRSLHQPGHLSPIVEDDLVSIESYDSDLDDASNLHVNQRAGDVPESRGSLRRLRSRRSLGGLRNYQDRTRRFGRAQPNILNAHSTGEADVLESPAGQHQPEITYDGGSMLSVVTGLQAQVASLQKNFQKSISTLLESLSTQFDGLNSQLSAVMNALTGYTGQSNQSVPAPSVSRAAPPPNPGQSVPPLNNASDRQLRFAEPGRSTVPGERVLDPNPAPAVATAPPPDHADDTVIPTEIRRRGQETVPDPTPAATSRTQGERFWERRASE
jgi:hypothetical protein